MTIQLKNQSNPISTGGGGVNFETRVQSAFVIAMLTGSSIPCLDDNMRVEEIKFQSKYAGNDTDDFVLFANDNKGNKSKLLAQIKREITISSDDSIFYEVINAAWNDFNKATFDKNTDIIVLVTGILPKLDINNTLQILEWAKYSSSADDFDLQSKTKGFTSKAKISKIEAFRNQLNKVNGGSEITNEQFWQFLKIFRILSYDLDSSSSIVSSLLCSLIGNHSDQPSDLVFSKIITTVQVYNQNAGTLTLNSIPEGLKTLFNKNPRQNIEEDIKILKMRSDYIFNRINNLILDVHIDRYECLENLFVKFNETDFIFVTGPRGTGKSGIVKDFVLKINKDVPVFYISAEDLNKPHLNDVFSSFNMKVPLEQLELYFSLIPKKILVIESLEKVLELSNANAFIDLLQFIKKQTGWIVIATGRDYAYQTITFNYLSPAGVNYSSIRVEEFEESQIKILCNRFPELKSLFTNKNISELTRTPFYIDLAIRAISKGAEFDVDNSEKDFKNIIWDSVISNSKDRKLGMPARRRNTFIDVAKKRVKQMTFWVNDLEFDAEVISKLEEDNLLYRDHNKSLVSPMHDVLEDWALEEFINLEYLNSYSDINIFFSSIGNQPPICRAFRLWLYQQIKFEVNMIEFILFILLSNELANYWKDETISAILQSQNPTVFLEKLDPYILENDCKLLIRLCFILIVACQKPRESITGSFFSVSPYGNGWEAIIKYINKNKENIYLPTTLHIVELLNNWITIININDDLPNVSNEVGQICLWLLKSMKNSYKNREICEKIVNVLLMVAVSINSEFDLLMVQDVFISKGGNTNSRLYYVEYLSSKTLNSLTHTPFLCKYYPEFVKNLALHEWLLDSADLEDSFNFHSRYLTTDINTQCGLTGKHDFWPPSGAKGPFYYLLQYHHWLGLEFIVHLCNVIMQNYIDFINVTHSSNQSITKIDIALNDHTIISQFASPDLWECYRGKTAVLPPIIQSALMALENWLIEYIKVSTSLEEVEQVLEYLMRESNSVLITAVIASITIAFQDKLGKFAFPLLRCPILYDFDIKRSINEVGEREINFFNPRSNNDFLAKIYAEERKTAALRPWRGESLETLLNKLQLNSRYKQDVFDILDTLKSLAITQNNQNLQVLLHRSDIRNLHVVKDAKNNIVVQNKNELPEDIKQSQEVINHEISNFSDSGELYLWSNKFLMEGVLSNNIFSDYKEAFFAAKILLEKFNDNDLGSATSIAKGAINKTIAICVMHNIQNMNDDDRDLCKTMIFGAVNERADIIDFDITDHFGFAICAYVLPIFFDFVINNEQDLELRYAIARAITHQNSNVRLHIAKGIRDFLWTRCNDFAYYSIAGAFEYAAFKNKESSSRQVINIDVDNQLQQIKEFRQNLVLGKYKLTVDNISLETHLSWYIGSPLYMIPVGTNEDIYISLIKKLLVFIFDDEHNSNYNSSGKIDYTVKKSIQDCFSEHLGHSIKNGFESFKEVLILGCVKAPNILYNIKLAYDNLMVKEKNYNGIWELWNHLAPELHKIAQNDLNEKVNSTSSIRLLRGMLLVDSPLSHYTDGREYIEPGTKILIDFAIKSGNNSHVFEALSFLMYQFHDLFFLEGISILADKYRQNHNIIKQRVNTAFYIEMSISNYLHAKNDKSIPKGIYNSCFELLEGIVETGSPNAYYLRELLISYRIIF